jgi:hypothetical protein
MTTKARMPSFGAAGKALWTKLHAVYVFEPKELIVLEMCCRQADNIAELDREIKKSGVIATGYSGQERISQCVIEVRQARIALARLLGELALPSVDSKPMSARSARAKRAADSRWTRVRAVRERQEERYGETAG